MPEPIHPETRIGHVHLEVAGLDRAPGFSCGVPGFALTQRMGARAAFVSAGGYHHHVGLDTWESAGGRPPAAGTNGVELHRDRPEAECPRDAQGQLAMVTRRLDLADLRTAR